MFHDHRFISQRKAYEPSKSLEKTLDWVAMFGWILMWVFFAFMTSVTFNKPVAALETVVLLVAVGALIFYHSHKIQTNKDENKDKDEFNARIVGHSSFTLYFLLTFLLKSVSKFQFYDWFGLFGNAYLLFAVAFNFSQLAGIAALVLYFLALFARKLLKFEIYQLLQTTGALLLLVYFTASTVIGFKKLF